MSLEQELAPFDYDLPDECIAVHPLAERSDSTIGVGVHLMNHETLWCRNGLLHPGDVLVLNDTRVLHARVQARRSTGGKEVFFLQNEPDADGTYSVLMKPSRRLKEGETLLVDQLDARICLMERQRTVSGE